MYPATFWKDGAADSKRLVGPGIIPEKTQAKPGAWG